LELKLRVKLPGPLNIVFLAFIFWFVSELSGWVFIAIGIRPVISYIAFLGFITIVLFLKIAQIQPIIHRKYRLHTRLIWYWIIIFIYWSIFNYVYSSHSPIAFQRLITTLEMSAIFAGFLLMLGSKNIIGAVSILLAILVVMGSTLNLYDFIQPTFSSVPGRAAGLYINPTTSGFLILLITTASLGAAPIFFRWILLTIGAVAIFATFSRGSWAVLFISISWLFLKGYLGLRNQRLIVGLFSIVAVGIFVDSIISGSLVQLIQNTSLERYLDSNTLARLGLSEFASDYSANERQYIANYAVEQFLNSSNPLFGYGLGYTHEWEPRVSTHNMYLLFLVEGGIVGLLVYLSLLFILWYKATGIGKLMVLQIVAFGFFSHNILDSPSRIFFFALIASGILNTVKINYSNKWI